MGRSLFEVVIRLTRVFAIEATYEQSEINGCQGDELIFCVNFGVEQALPVAN